MQEDTLPIDELDPCCQEEILQRRNRDNISTRLRKFDKLNSRSDTVKSVFRLHKYEQCPCCKNQTVDYPMLAKVRRQFEALTDETYEDAKKVNEIDDDDDGDDDDSEFWAELEMACPTDGEEERLRQMKANAEIRGAAILQGFGVHIEDSPAHINELILQGRTIVCHIVNASMLLCGYIDHALEKLSIKYLGSNFRRVMLDEKTYPFMQKWTIALVDGARPMLVSFKGGALVTCTADLHQFGDGSDPMIYVGELEKYLNNLGCLHLSHNDSMKPLPLQTSDDEYSDDENSKSYCDIDGCGRDYPHEHVTATGGGTMGGAAAADRGAEALAKDWCYKM